MDHEAAVHNKLFSTEKDLGRKNCLGTRKSTRSFRGPRLYGAGRRGHEGIKGERGRIRASLAEQNVGVVPIMEVATEGLGALEGGTSNNLKAGSGCRKGGRERGRAGEPPYPPTRYWAFEGGGEGPGIADPSTKKDPALCALLGYSGGDKKVPGLLIGGQ